MAPKVNAEMWAKIHKIYRVIEEFRKLEAEIPSQAINTFLYVVLNEGTSQKEIGEALGLSQASTSRNVAMLSRLNRYNKPGFNLIESREDPLERRKKIVTLTPKGRRLVQDLEYILER